MGIKINALLQENPQTTAIMRYRKSKEIKPGFTALKNIPVDFTRCVIFIEDFDFFKHHGFHLESIQFAIELNQRLGYLAYGGSTITQQLARTLFLTPEKSYVRKYFELLIAIEMELILSKDRILELYLNYAEWGKDIYGITDAARFYFNKEVAKLNDNEKLEIITIMPNPLHYSPTTYIQSNILRARYKALFRFYSFVKNLPPRFKSEI